MIDLNFSVSSIVGGLLFSTIGIYVFKRGKKFANIPWIALGVALCIYPYFIASPVLMWVIGVVLIGCAYLTKTN